MNSARLGLMHLFFSHEGRINRGMWWISQILIILISSTVMWIENILDLHDAIWGFILAIFMVVSRFMLNIKRVHDRGKSGWWILIFEIPVIGWIWGLIELGFLSGDKEENHQNLRAGNPCIDAGEEARSN